MKLPKTTLFLVLIALGLGGFVYFYEIKGATKRAASREQGQQIFSFTEDEIQSLTVKTEDITLGLQRNPESGRPKWLLTQPSPQPANDAIVGYLTNLLVNGTSDRILPTSTNKLKEFGLDQPVATININLKNQTKQQLILGKPDFNNKFIYAKTDANTGQNDMINVLLVSQDFHNAVNRPLSEWQPIPEPNSTEETEKPD